MDISVLTFLTIVLVLACFIGYHVIWGVTPALHTPLMAVTNAISGIVIIAAILITGDETMEDIICFLAACPSKDYVQNAQLWAKILGFLAITLASINIFGGFGITRRMLAMFQKKDRK